MSPDVKHTTTCNFVRTRHNCSVAHRTDAQGSAVSGNCCLLRWIATNEEWSKFWPAEPRQSGVFVGQADGRMLQKPISSGKQVAKHVLRTVSAVTSEASTWCSVKKQKNKNCTDETHNSINCCRCVSTYVFVFLSAQKKKLFLADVRAVEQSQA